MNGSVERLRHDGNVRSDETLDGKHIDTLGLARTHEIVRVGQRTPRDRSNDVPFVVSNVMFVSLLSFHTMREGERRTRTSELRRQRW